jgi:hypothetical protein
MKRLERRKFISKMFDHLSWLKSKENADRMEDKGMLASGITHDAVMMIFDFAEKENVPFIQLLDWLVIGVAMQSHPDSQTRKDFMKVWKVIEPLSREAFRKRLEQ